MLRVLKMRNFRRHTDTDIVFTPGMNALRGANESGKSTVIEAVLYALYGSTALRDTLAETVTWSKKEGDLKVELIISIDDRDYVFKRSKAGAEVNYHDGEKDRKVTGQKEVTAFSAELLGADAKMASLLMLASQSGLRGALDDGPTAVSGLMGKLADFDLIDRIVEAAQAQLQLGSADPLKQKLAASEVEVADATASMPSDEAELNAEMLRVNHAEQLAAVETERVTTLQPALLAAEQRYMEARATRDERERLAMQASTLLNRRSSVAADISTQQVLAAARPDAEAIQALRTKLANLNTIAGHVKAHQAFLALPKYPEVFWDEPRATFDAEEERLEALRDQQRGAISTFDGEIAGLTRQRITSGKCPTCGHAAMTDEHVAEHNTQIDAQVTAKRAERTKVADQLVETESTLTSLRNLDRTAQTIIQAAAKVLNHLDMDDSVFPPRFTWKGEVPQPVDVEGTKRELAALEGEDKAASMAEGSVAALLQQRDQIDADLRANGAAAQALPPDTDLTPLEQSARAAGAVHLEAQQRVETLRRQIGEYERERDNARRVREGCEARLKTAQARIAEINEDLKALAFNNTLVGKLRKLKPAITDHLWNTVLAAVSNFFSSIRGEQSVVSKTADGFRVNDRSIESLSGSTLDALAIAIRVALTKTFIPHAPFIVLDEPAHGCDDARTGNVLGFLAAVGFTQTILASHDELSEAVADNVIALGA